MTKRKRIKLWAVIEPELEKLEMIHIGHTWEQAERVCIYGDGHRVVRLVEHEPAVDAVARAAIKFCKWSSFSGDELMEAVQRLEQVRAKK